MPEEASSTFHPPKQEMRPPSSVCVGGSLMFWRASLLFFTYQQIVASSVRHDHRGRIPVEKRRGVNAVASFVVNSCSVLARYFFANWEASRIWSVGHTWGASACMRQTHTNS